MNTLTALSNDVGVVGIGDVHLHGDPVVLGVQVGHDAVLGPLHAFFGPADADVRV